MVIGDPSDNLQIWLLSPKGLLAKETGVLDRDQLRGLDSVTCKGHTNLVGSVAWSPNGINLVAVSKDKSTASFSKYISDFRVL